MKGKTFYPETLRRITAPQPHTSHRIPTALISYADTLEVIKFIVICYCSSGECICHPDVFLGRFKQKWGHVQLVSNNSELLTTM